MYLPTPFTARWRARWRCLSVNHSTGRSRATHNTYRKIEDAPPLSSVVLQTFRIAIPEVRFGVGRELDCADRLAALQKGSGDSVHAVHHSAVVAKDDRVLDFDLFDEANVVDDPAYRRTLTLTVEPILRVDFVDRGDLNFDDREVASQDEQSVDVPRVKPRGATPEVVLLAHGDSFA